jgi:glc operon protein GlcG
MPQEETRMTSIRNAIAALACLAASPVLALESVPVLDQSTADTVVRGCLEHAGRAGEEVSVAVFDQAGNIVAFARGRGTPASAELAQWKARSAAIYRNSTRETGSWNAPYIPHLASVEGGVPLLTADGAYVGGVGVSGAPPEFDADCAEAGARLAGLQVRR